MDVCAVYAGWRYPVEVKLACKRALTEGLEQLECYADKCGAAEGWLVIFDRASGKSWDEKIFWDTQTLPSGKTAHIVGC